ncbi:hypothetical protein KFL_003970120 [Klebsormidium nitens]|uniref:Uncharacterized protein n=1 Tax=Klebsormidium nitens TaxID=105231 RepID=A0A1Y1IAS5_KLENI|nr:hypothetical protein KFL_003970120 [Klebsormidium nitens]|eukprot:GAQ88065.1 hypothetical protein KFL_003970120 [Klebsormidium nitens]
MASAAVLFKAAGAKALCSCGQADITPAMPQRFGFRALPRPLFEGSRLGRFHSEYKVCSGLRRLSPRAETPRGRAESAGSPSGDNRKPQVADLKAQALTPSIERAEKRIERVENQIDVVAAAAAAAAADGKSTELLEQRLVALEQRLVALEQQKAALEQRLTALMQAEVESLKLQRTPAVAAQDPAVLERLQKYAEYIAQVDIASGFIDIPHELREGMPPGLRDSIFIRESYRTVLKKLEALGNDFAVVLSGTPGIGKSAFAVLLLHHLAKQGAQVAYRYKDEATRDTIIFFDFSDPSAINVKRASESAADFPSLESLSARPTVWRVIDGRAPPHTQFRGYGRCVVLCSPNRGNYWEFVKGRGCFLWWLPVWTLKELEDCREHLYEQVSQEQMEKRAKEFGGLVRHVLANPTSSFDDIARTLDADQAVELYNLSAQSSDSEVRHIFAHIEATEDLEWVGYTLGSQKIKELVYQKAKLGRWRDLTTMLRAAAEEPTLGKLTGDLLEQNGHDMCQQGIALDPEDVKEVSKGAVGRPRMETEAEKEAEKEQREQAIKEIQEAFGGSKEKKYDAPSKGIDLAKLERPTYVKPLVKTQESWDSLVCSGDGWSTQSSSRATSSIDVAQKGCGSWWSAPAQAE